jgi:hypothetical protein
VAKAKTGMFEICHNKFLTMQYKKIKSRGSEVFDCINEFLNERILFFGKKRQQSKTVGKKKTVLVK